MAAFLLQSVYKVGSTWTFILTRRDIHGVPIDLTGLSVRAMFREASPDGEVIVTLTDALGILTDPQAGSVLLTLTPDQSVLFAPGSRVVFDVEMSRVGYAWQSPTLKFKTEQEVTRG